MKRSLLKKRIAEITAVCLLTTSVVYFDTSIFTGPEVKVAEASGTGVRNINLPDSNGKIPGIENPNQTTDISAEWSGSKVRFGNVGIPMRWKVLSVNTTDYSADGTESMLLLSDNELYVCAYSGGLSDSDVTTSWEDSDVRYNLSANFQTFFTKPLQEAVIASTKEAGNEISVWDKRNSATMKLDNPALSKDKLFCLSAEEIVNKEYGFAVDKDSNERFVGESNTLIVNTFKYWLRSSVTNGTEIDGIGAEKAVAVVDDSFISWEILTLYSGSYAVVPALNVDLSKIAFTRDADYSFASGDRMVATESTDADKVWDIVVEGGTGFNVGLAEGQDACYPGETYTFMVKSLGEDTDTEYEQISAMLVNKDTNEVVKYGKVRDAAGTTNIEIAIPEIGEGENYTLRLFAENVTDRYVSNQVEFEIKTEASASEEPTGTPTTEPTGTPTAEPTGTPTAEPTATPTAEPTVTPEATADPTTEPTVTPEATAAPSDDFTDTPSTEPTPEESASPDTPTELPEESTSPEPTPLPEGEEVQVGDVTYKVGSDATVSLSSMPADSTEASLTIPDTVTIEGVEYALVKIDSGAFAGNTKLKDVTLGKNITTIESKAFKNCKNMRTMTYNDQLESIGAEAFMSCKKLTALSLPASLKKIGKRAFKKCASLKKVKIGKKKSGGMVMAGGIELPDVETVTKQVPSYRALDLKLTLGSNVFENCAKLKSVIINSAVTVIGNSAFKNCSTLSSIIVRSLVLKTVGKKALVGVSKCKISVPTQKYKPYRKLFKNKGQGKKVFVAKA